MGLPVAMNSETGPEPEINGAQAQDSQQTRDSQTAAE